MKSNQWILGLALCFTMSLVSLPLVAQASGGDSSAGGGGGNLHLASGFAPNQFSITSFSSKTGVIGTVLSYYLLAGGVRSENNVMIWYNISGQDSDNAIIESKQVQPDDSTYLQLNFQIAYADLLELRSGLSDQAQATTISFRGTLASDLYAGMDKSGLKPVGFTIDPATQQEYGKILSDGGLFCEKKPQGVDCSLTFARVDSQAPVGK